MSDHSNQMPETGSIKIEDELRHSYLDYAMSVIVGRALPDVRDGLKPVHRRVLFAMSQLGNDWNKAYKKSARVVGDVIGKYHPHGDSAVYETLVRMAQDFSMRYMLIDGQGNFGSIDGDAPAAMRYTEVRMMRLTHEVLADLDQETVDFVPNYDETEQMPAVMPTRFPNLLLNGATGIAVGMATNIPPHNLDEVFRTCLALIDRPEMTVDELIAMLPGPDFPTGGIINGRSGIVEAYRSGHGVIRLRAKASVAYDESKGRDVIVVSEIPYQLNKTRLLEKIAALHKEGRITGISQLRDESDKDGLRIVIELKRGENGEVTLNNLYSQSQLETTYGINMVALENGQPRLFGLKGLLSAFIGHRREVVTRRTICLLRKAVERGHGLEGLSVALANIDHVVELIKTSRDAAEARVRLMAEQWSPGDAVDAMLQRADAGATRPEGLGVQFGLLDGAYRMSEAQAKAILELRLHRLTGLEQDKLIGDFSECLEEIAAHQQILRHPERLTEVVRDELCAIQQQYADERRTEIRESREDLEDEDLIAHEERIVTLSLQGYVKSQSLDDYNAQHRGGVGRQATTLKDEDCLERLVVANTHDTLLCFSDRGRVYWLKVYQVPVGGHGARGRPIVNVLQLEEGEKITAMLALEGYPEGSFMVMATRRGVIKKTPLEKFSRPRRIGLRVITLDEGDYLEKVAVSEGEDDIMLFSSDGRGVRFNESKLRAMGRSAHGVRGMRLTEGSRIVGMIVPRPACELLIVTRNGYGKRSQVAAFPRKSRGVRGVVAIRTNQRNGEVAAVIGVFPKDECMLISDQGTLLRSFAEEISLLGRNTQGLRVIRLKNNEHLICAERIQLSVDEADAPQPAEAVAQAEQEDALPADESANGSEAS